MLICKTIPQCLSLVELLGFWGTFFRYYLISTVWKLGLNDSCWNIPIFVIKSSAVANINLRGAINMFVDRSQLYSDTITSHWDLSKNFPKAFLYSWHMYYVNRILNYKYLHNFHTLGCRTEQLLSTWLPSTATLSWWGASALRGATWRQSRSTGSLPTRWRLTPDTTRSQLSSTTSDRYYLCTQNSA